MRAHGDCTRARLTRGGFSVQTLTHHGQRAFSSPCCLLSSVFRLRPLRGAVAERRRGGESAEGASVQPHTRAQGLRHHRAHGSGRLCTCRACRPSPCRRGGGSSRDPRRVHSGCRARLPRGQAPHPRCPRSTSQHACVVCGCRGLCADVEVYARMSRFPRGSQGSRGEDAAAARVARELRLSLGVLPDYAAQ